MRQPTGLTLIAALLIGPVLLPAQSARPASDDEIEKASAIARSRPTSAAWSRLGDAYMQKARETMDLSYYGRAEASYREALTLNPNYANALVGVAWVLSGRHEFEQSIEWAAKALKIEPNRADAYGLLGDAATEMGDYDSAFEHYQKMLDLKPDIASYSRAAHLLFVTGGFRKATLLMSKAIGSGGAYPENRAWCIAQLALLDFAQGAYVPAEQLLSQALKETPSNYHLLAAMGKVKAAQKDFPAAVEYYKGAQAIVPQHEVVVALGDLYTLAGRTEDANRQYALVDVLRKLNKANGVTGDLQMAQFLADHDRDLDGALRLAEAEYKTRPTVYGADTLAWCYYKNGRIPEARKYSSKALSQNTPEALFFYHRGLILAKGGDIGEARRTLYQALSQNPYFDPLGAVVAMKMVQELGSVAVGGK
ncbi:MAG: tetratricopeptide repeat protein [Bryobacteraceae bacterium]|jgi:tetratricopeptide (TPR) repeat protein